MCTILNVLLTGHFNFSSQQLNTIISLYNIIIAHTRIVLVQNSIPKTYIYNILS